MGGARRNLASEHANYPSELPERLDRLVLGEQLTCNPQKIAAPRIEVLAPHPLFDPALFGDSDWPRSTRPGARQP